MRKDKDFNRILAKYERKWTVLSEDYRVISRGYNAKKIYKETKKIEVSTLFKVPKFTNIGMISVMWIQRS